MSDIPALPQEEEVGLIALDLNDQLVKADHLPDLTAPEAMATYRMMMSGIVSRLFLYLYGEIDREKAERAVAIIDERLTVYREIVALKVAPMRAVYEYLIKQRVIEREELGDEANAHLDLKDRLQDRIIEEELVNRDVVEVIEPPTYSVPSVVNLPHVGPPAEIRPLGPCDPNNLTFWGGKTVASEDSVLTQVSDRRLLDWAKIQLNGDIKPGAASRYTLLYKPTSKLGE
ncbi:hypothetical protein [Xanthomonas phage RTH11]|nr:hypothetical protein [Xanthomonas phage RTH11]